MHSAERRGTNGGVHAMRGNVALNTQLLSAPPVADRLESEQLDAVVIMHLAGACRFAAKVTRAQSAQMASHRDEHYSTHT
eukprot:4367671-Pyramimonas_sp.AAC.1